MSDQSGVANTKKSKIDLSKKLEIIAEYHKYKNCSRVANKYGVSRNTSINWIAKEKNTEKEVKCDLGNKQSLKFNLSEKLEMIAEYHKCKNYLSIANKYGINVKTIIKWVGKEKDIRKQVEKGFGERQGLKKQPVKGPKYNLLKKLEIITEFRVCKNYTSISNKYGVDVKTIVSWIANEKNIRKEVEEGFGEKLNMKRQSKNLKINPLRKLEVISQYHACKSYTSVSNNCGISRKTIEYWVSKEKEIREEAEREFSENNFEKCLYDIVPPKEIETIESVIVEDGNILKDMTPYVEENNLDTNETDLYTNEFDHEYMIEDNFNFVETGIYSNDHVTDNYNINETNPYLTELNNYVREF